MSRCRSCGAEIIWIRMKATGKAMPCDAKIISYSENMHPGAGQALTLVTEYGTVVRTVFDPAGDKIGYTSHFATCPNANQHRREEMAQEYISIMDKIKRPHAMLNALPCMEFDYSINPYLGYWYAEDRLYVLNDCMVDAYYFIEANSPKEAIEKVIKRVEEAEHAGEWVEEEYE